jgi:predicted MFS family arabinose efflux permease
LFVLPIVLHVTPGTARPAKRHAERGASVIRDRDLHRLAGLYASSFGTSVVVGTWVVTFLDRTAGYSTPAAGAVGALTLFGGIASRPFGGWVVARRPHLARRVVAGGLLAGAGGTVLLGLAPPLPLAVLASASVGVGAGIPFGPVFSGAQLLRPDRPASAVGFVNSVANAAVVVGVPLVGLTFSIGDGRVGFVAVACLWGSAVLLLPSGDVLRGRARAEHVRAPAA